MKRHVLTTAAVVALGGSAWLATAWASEAVAPPATQPAAPAAKWAPAVSPKPLSQNVQRGLAFLASTQNADARWRPSARKRPRASRSWHRPPA